MRVKQILIIAAKEMQDGLRNRWLLLISLILLILSLCVALGSSAVSGQLVVPELANLLSGLVTLSVFLLPLAAILLTYDAFVGEHEAGTLLLILTYPVSRWQLLCGKLIGHAGLLLAACLLGFLPAAVLSYGLTDTGFVQVICGFANFIASAWLLALVFVLVGYLVSLSVKEKAKSLAILLLIWFVVALIYDLALLASVVALADILSRQALNLLILMNPADVFRAINLFSLTMSNQIQQSALVALTNTGFSLAHLYLIMLAWLAALLAACQLRFQLKNL